MVNQPPDLNPNGLEMARLAYQAIYDQTSDSHRAIEAAVRAWEKDRAWEKEKLVTEQWVKSGSKK